MELHFYCWTKKKTLTLLLLKCELGNVGVYDKKYAIFCKASLMFHKSYT